MEKKSGYRIILTDGTRLFALPNSNEIFEMSIGETMIRIEKGLVNITGVIEGGPFTSEIKEISADMTDPPSERTMTCKSLIEENQEKGAKRTCIVCGSRYYCITNGCANTPCGWICG